MPAIRPAGYCPRCSYAIDPGICPECGESVALATLASAADLDVGAVAELVQELVNGQAAAVGGMP